MAFDYGGAGNLLGGIGSLVGAAGDIYSAFQSPPKSGGGQPYKGLINSPAYSFGGGQLTRRNDDFLEGQRRLRGLLTEQLGRVRPGYGALTESGVNAIRQRAAEASGNLRAQLGRRSLLGASFADDALGRVGMEYQQAEQEFRRQAFVDEMNATNELLDRESVSLLTQAQQELQELGIATSFLNSVAQVATTQKEIDRLIAEKKLLDKFQMPTQSNVPASLAGPSAGGGTPAAAPRPLPPDTGQVKPGPKGTPVGGMDDPRMGGGGSTRPRRPGGRLVDSIRGFR